MPFGGNASNVAIMGESSGGAAVGVHLILDKSWGLFHKAIGESPGLTQVKSLEDAELNYQYVLGALLALKSPGCVHEDNDEASYATFEHTELRMSDYGPRGPSSSVLETHVGWDYKQAAAACDALPNCHGFNILVAAANTTVYLVNTTKLYDVTVRSALPAGQSVTAYLKAAAGGAKGVQCLVQADAKVLMQGINSFAPRADTFQTDTWAPVLDGGKCRPGGSAAGGLEYGRGDDLYEPRADDSVQRERRRLSRLGECLLRSHPRPSRAARLHGTPPAGPALPEPRSWPARGRQVLHGGDALGG